MVLVLFKSTLLFAVALACLLFMRRASSVTRHLVCVCAMTGALLLPLTLLAPPEAAPIRLSPITFLATSSSGVAAPAWSLSKVLLIVWLGGVLLMLLRLGVGHWKVAEVLRTAIPGDGFVFTDVSVPMVAGLLRPVILMPRSAEFWPLSQRAAALKHERAHLDRKDLWTSLIAHLVCALYWFHPLAWAVAGRLRREQETACDDAVLCSGFEPASYAEALIATARQITSTNLIGCHMTQKTLKSRITRLFENGMPRMSSPQTLRRIAIGFVAVAAVIALLNGSHPVLTARAQERGIATPPAPSTPPSSAESSAAPAKPVAEAVAQKPAGKPAEAPAGASNPGPADNPFSVGNGVTPPHVLTKVDPVYTDEAKAAKISGPVMLSIVVGTDGFAHDINVVSGIDSGLDLNAVAAVQQWQFQPGTKDGEPVAVRAQIEVNFKLL